MPTFGTFTDSRDGHVYKTVLMPDGNWWAAENLAWNGGDRLAPNMNVANVAEFGWLYLIEEAPSYVPDGTHHPSEDEWDAVMQGDGTAFGYAELVSILDGGTNESGFDVRLAGIGFFDDATLLGSYGAFRYSDRVGSTINFVSESVLIGGGGPAETYASIRFIVNPPPNYVSLYGAETQGFERGYSVEASRSIAWQDTLGFAPVGIPYAPADKDEWIIDAELWVNAAQATALEAAVPPFGVPSSLTICVPNRGGENTFAGLAPATFGSIADAYADPVVLEWESLGQKGPRLELYGYRIKFSLSCSSTSNPYSSNPATAPTTTPPAWLLNKFRAHQIQDGSVEARVIGADGKWTGSANPIKSGRRRDLNFNLDHLSPAQMDELVAFYRGIRSNEFYLWTDANPLPNFLPHPFKAIGLSFQRGAGLWWDATLELVRA